VSGKGCIIKLLRCVCFHIFNIAVLRTIFTVF
jgi:hypothetical protein